MIIINQHLQACLGLGPLSTEPKVAGSMKTEDF